MSNWKNIKKEDLDIDNGDLDVFISKDDNGNNYIIIKISDILQLLAKKYNE